MHGEETPVKTGVVDVFDGGGELGQQAEER